MPIHFFINETSIKIPERRKLKQFINQLFIREGMVLNVLTYIFCTDKYLLSINKEFLHHDDYTDIITFCLSNPLEPIVGEIYISVDRIIENAEQLGQGINRELHRVMFHGALHLCGYKDKTPVDKIIMTKQEDRNLLLYFN